MNYEIKNLKAFARKVGKTVAEDLELETSELKDYITIKNVLQLTAQYCMYDKYSKKYVANETILETIIDETRNWIVGLTLARMASQGQLECAWDDKMDCMIFWRPENAEEETD